MKRPHMTKKAAGVILSLLLAGSLTACAKTADGTTPSPTATAQPTRQAEETPEAEATPKAEATLTPEVTATPKPTETPAPTATPVPEEKTVSEDELTALRMAEPEALYSDVVAGIDYSTVKTEGEKVYFSSVMSDGTVVRFEGTNLSVTEEGILINPCSSLLSLDAIGKIYSYSVTVKDAQNYQYRNERRDYEYALNLGGGYTYQKDKTSVEAADEIHTNVCNAARPDGWDGKTEYAVSYFQPNFIYVCDVGYSKGSFLLTELKVGYNPTEKVTAMSAAKLNNEFTTPYFEGELYNVEAENGGLSFYLLLKPDVPETTDENYGWIWYVPEKFYTVGDLKDAQGNVLDKNHAAVYKGTTVDVTVGDYTLSVELELLERFSGASVMHDLVPYAYPEAVGTKNVLVVPVVWSDQKEMATEENRTSLKKVLGRVMEENGECTDYSEPDSQYPSLSSYFDTASYGKMEVNCFVTDWYEYNASFSEYESYAVEKQYADTILRWVKRTYPQLDWSQFDQDQNGYVDSVILVNYGVSQSEEYSVFSYNGAVHNRSTYLGEYAGTTSSPNINCYVTINQSFLQNGATGTLIHEFSHNFGLIDYYDVNYSGINAVGGYDMQSYNAGDWNAYSKLAVGWISPQVVSGLASGESVELTIGSSALQGDVIVLPAAGASYDGPFGEYVMIDLLSDDGVNTYYTADYGLTGVNGVRISHVNANMEKRVLEAEVFKEGRYVFETNELGTIHFANQYKNDEKGFYNIEVIQSGKKNTFTKLSNPVTNLTAEDLFYAGDTFTAEEYSEFFYNGRMDDGSALGYTVDIVSVGTGENGEPQAVIRITAD